MKVLKEAQEFAREIKHKVYRVDTCGYCKNDLMFTMEDCEIELFNPVKKEGTLYKHIDGHYVAEPVIDTVSSDSREDVFTFICPYCGHIQKITREEYSKLRRVGWDGTEHITFELDEVETAAAKEFMKEHSKSCAKKQNLTLGEYFSYNITPTGLGDACSIQCNLCKTTKNLTNYDNW